MSTHVAAHNKNNLHGKKIINDEWKKRKRKKIKKKELCHYKMKLL